MHISERGTYKKYLNKMEGLIWEEALIAFTVGYSENFISLDKVLFGRKKLTKIFNQTIFSYN